MLKETSSRPVLEAIRRARILQPEAKIEVEVENLAALEEALQGKADVIILDNMYPTAVAEAVESQVEELTWKLPAESLWTM